jgi:uncharacterized protein YcbK (DUF882 family)
MTFDRSVIIGLSTCACLFFLSFPLVFAQPKPAPFFLMGDGRIHIKSIKNHLEADVTLLNPNGSFNETAFDRIDRVFGYTDHRKGEHISLRLIFMLDYFSDLVAPGKTIYLTSGYRSPEYNAALKKEGGIVARTSTHMDGLALDFYIEGINGKELWEIIRQKNCGGVGNYGGKEVHLDASRPRFWEAATSKVDTNESDYNRRMFLSTEFDRYRPGQNLRLSFSSVSDFGFGVKKKATLTAEPGGNIPVMEIDLLSQKPGDCLAINDREASHFIYLTLPQKIKAGRYRLQLDFCNRPFEQMPLTIVSNEIEVVSPGP